MKRMEFTIRGGRRKVSPAIVGRRCDLWIDDLWIGEVKLQEIAAVRDGHHVALVGSPGVIKKAAALLPDGPSPPKIQLHPVRRPLPLEGRRP